MYRLDFDTFAWWDEGRNHLDVEIKSEIRLLLLESVGWLEFNRAHGNILIDIEYESNHPVLQIIIKAHIVESIMEYNETTTNERKVAISQNDINFRQEANELDIDLNFYLLNNLQRRSFQVQII